MTSREAITKREHYDTADKFLEALRVFEPTVLSDAKRKEHLFRGHADDNWSLLPSALRDDGFLRVLANPMYDFQGEQLSAEWYVMLAFMHFANKTGLPIPEDSIAFRDFLAGYPGRLFNSAELTEDVIWPPRQFHALLALARHASLPTRLLDWTSNRWNAAYFAASGAAERVVYGEVGPDDRTNLSVWIVEASRFARLIRQPSNIGSVYRNSSHVPVEFFNVPNSSNPNARAQGGWFSVVRTVHSLKAPVDRSPLDAVIANNLRYEMSNDVIFRRLTLPISQARRLLEKLAVQDVTCASVFPDYYGAANAVKEFHLHESG